MFKLRKVETYLCRYGPSRLLFLATAVDIVAIELAALTEEVSAVEARYCLPADKRTAVAEVAAPHEGDELLLWRRRTRRRVGGLSVGCGIVDGAV